MILYITDVIKEWIGLVVVILVDGNKGFVDVCVIELGGIVGKVGFVCNL